MVATSPQLPLLDQIWDSLLGKKDAVLWSPPRDARNVTVLHRGLAQVDQMNWQALTPE